MKVRRQVARTCGKLEPGFHLGTTTGAAGAAAACSATATGCTRSRAPRAASRSRYCIRSRCFPLLSRGCRRLSGRAQPSAAGARPRVPSLCLRTQRHVAVRSVDVESVGNYRARIAAYARCAGSSARYSSRAISVLALTGLAVSAADAGGAALDCGASSPAPRCREGA